MANATVTATKGVCLKAALENALEIEYTAAGDYTLPKDAIVAAIIPGKCGGTAVVKSLRTKSGETITPAVLTLNVGLAGKTNSVFVLLE